MPAASVTRPISPPSASTSRARFPFPTPPTAGLQDLFAIVPREHVSRRVERPIRAAACAASQPACPAPTTTTSKLIVAPSLSDAEPGKEAVERVLGGGLPHEIPQDSERFLDMGHGHLG